MRIEYYTSLSDTAQIPLPSDIESQLILKPNQKIRVIIEVPQPGKDPVKQYSFEKVRKLLSGIKGNMSEDISEDRSGRI